MVTRTKSDPKNATRSHLIKYCSHLAENYAKATAAKLSVAHHLLDEAVKRAVILAYYPDIPVNTLLTDF